MKKFYLLLNLTTLIISSHAAFASYDNVADYLRDMDTKGLPRVLVVGCGHLEYGVHTEPSQHQHKNEWCVDVENSSVFEPQWQQSKEEVKEDLEAHWQYIKANAQLDITTSNVFAYASGYKSAFDVVVLERNWSSTLNSPYTLYNAASMLKEDGTLVVDVHSTYSFNSYSYDGQNSLMALEIPELTMDPVSMALQLENSSLDDVRNYLDPEEFPAAKNRLEDTFKQFGVTFPTQEDKALSLSSKLKGMASYLIGWGFTTVVPFELAYQPWTKEDGKEDIKTARQGGLLVAIKSAQTSASMKEWLTQLKKLKKK